MHTGLAKSELSCTVMSTAPCSKLQLIQHVGQSALARRCPHYLFEEGQRISLLKCVRLHLRSGDHTVKITCCATGKCLRVLEGHRRTPWVVRFHPSDSSLLASGSLDHQVWFLLLSAHNIL